MIGKVFTFSIDAIFSYIFYVKLALSDMEPRNKEDQLYVV